MITSAQIPTLGGRYYLQKAARHNYLNEIKERKPRRRLRLALTVAILVTDIIFAVALVDPRWLSFAYSSALRWMSTAVLIAFLVLNFRGWRSAQDELLSVCFGIFCATAVTSTVLRNEDLSDGLQRAIALLAVYFLAFVLVRSIPPDVIIKSWTSALYWVSIASCGASALVLTRADAYNLGRFSGIFQTPNFLGSASAIAIVLSLVKIGSDRGALGWFSLLFLPISAYCLYACNSRTNTAAVIIVFLCLPFYFRAKRVTALVIVAFVLVVAGLVLNVGGSLIPVSLVQRHLIERASG
jgi:hypothetical protein